MSEINYLCSDIGDHELVTCGQYKKGGIPTIAFLELDHAITDFTNASQWQTAIGTGKAHIIGGEGFKAEYTDPSPVETDNPSACGAANIVDALDHTFNFMDSNVTASNDTFYGNVNRQLGYLVFFNCVNNTISVVEKQCTWLVLPAKSPYSNKERRAYTGKITWTSEVDEFPELLAAPTGIFD